MLMDLTSNGSLIPSAHRTPFGDDFGQDLPLLFELHEI